LHYITCCFESAFNIADNKESRAILEDRTIKENTRTASIEDGIMCKEEAFLAVEPPVLL